MGGGKKKSFPPCFTDYSLYFFTACLNIYGNVVMHPAPLPTKAK